MSKFRTTKQSTQQLKRLLNENNQIEIFLLSSRSIQRFSSQRSEVKFAFVRKSNGLKSEESSSLKESFVESSKNSSKMFSRSSKKMTRFGNAIIVQIRTNKIELKNYFHKIKTIEFFKYSCEIRRQTMHHTLLKCSKHDDFRKKM
jgi:hypothetical protein